MMIMLVYRTND